MTFEFPIQPPKDNTSMNNIPHWILTIFKGETIEDPDMFIFDFGVLYNSYDQQSDAQKIKLFPATLKDATLRWFMSFRDISTWDQMKESFLEKYQEYSKTKEV